MVFPNGLLGSKLGSSKTSLPDQILTRCLLEKKSGLLGSLGEAPADCSFFRRRATDCRLVFDSLASSTISQICCGETKVDFVLARAPGVSTLLLSSIGDKDSERMKHICFHYNVLHFTILNNLYKPLQS